MSSASCKGPVFTNILLADEINRTPPKTQAALLAGDAGTRSHRPASRPTTLPEPFFVIATQNPIEQEGTYPLPEAQLDRFMFNIKVDYPIARRRGTNSRGHHDGRTTRGPQSAFRESRFCICRSRSTRSRSGR